MEKKIGGELKLRPQVEQSKGPERIIIEVSPEEFAFIQYCRELKWGKLTGVLVKDGIPISADQVRVDVRFDRPAR